MLWRSFVQAYCFSSTFFFLCSVVADDSESRDSTGGGVSCGTGEADGSPDVLDFPFPLPFGGIFTNCLTKKTRRNGNVTVDRVWKRRTVVTWSICYELGLNSDRIATLRTNWDYIATFARRSHECRILLAILSQLNSSRLRGDYFANPANRLRCYATTLGQI